MDGHTEMTKQTVFKMHLNQLFNNVSGYKNVSQVLEDSKKRGKCKKSKRNDCGKE
jgi:hypothetical protein